MAGNPEVTFCPYLPLEQEIQLGPWRVCPLASFEGPWLSPAFETLARLLINAHRDVHGNRLQAPAIVYHATNGASGRAPRRDVLDRMHAVLNLAVLSENPEWQEGSAGHSVATADNSQIVVWPIDVSSKRKTIAVRRGAIVQILTGGYEINHDLHIHPPDGLNVPMMPLRLDDKELYNHLWSFFRGNADVVSRVRLALHWLAKAWINTAAVHPGDRIVFLKTGFEALLAKGGRKRDEGMALRSLFEKAYHGAGTGEVEGLLWSPRERPTLRWRDKNWKPTHSPDHVTPLQRWYLDFAEQRNALIHDGVIQSFPYRRKGYAGPHFFTASRVLLEAIRTTVGAHAGVRLALKPWDRRKRELYETVGKMLRAARRPTA